MGAYYCINVCERYPIKNKELCILLQEIAKLGCSYTGHFEQVCSEDFKYEDAMDEKYPSIRDVKNVIEQMNYNTLYNVDIHFPDIIETRILMEWLDEEYYSVCFVMDEEDLEKVHNQKLLQKISDLLFDIIEPIYGTFGIESCVDSLNLDDVEDCLYHTEKVYIGRNIDKKMDKDFLEKLKYFYEIEKEKNGIFLTMRNNIKDSEEIALEKELIHCIQKYM